MADKTYLGAERAADVAVHATKRQADVSWQTVGERQPNPWSHDPPTYGNVPTKPPRTVVLEMDGTVNNLIGMYNFGASNDLGLDSSGNGRNGTNFRATWSSLRGGSADLASVATPDLIQCIELNSAVGPIIRNSGTNFTVSLWFKATSTAQITMFNVSDNRVAQSEVWLYMAIAGNIFGHVRLNGANLFRFQTVAAYNDGNWHHVVFSVGSQGNLLYVDNVQITGAALTYVFGSASSTGNWNTIPFTNVTIGAAISSTSVPNYRGNFIGGLDNVALFNSYLDTATIAKLYNDTYVPLPLGLHYLQEIDGTMSWDVKLPHIGRLQPGTVVYWRDNVMPATSSGKMSLSGIGTWTKTRELSADWIASADGTMTPSDYTPVAATVADLDLFLGRKVTLKHTFGNLAGYSRVTLVFVEPGAVYL